MQNTHIKPKTKNSLANIRYQFETTWLEEKVC